ncbi:MAG: alpha/beta hydrolase [Lachnospiraceae bacterium]|nr:alpha/beta hydrolase [Lachnospiraceae bacterium]
MYDVKKTFVRLTGRTPGVLYEPKEATAKQRIAVLVMHSDEDYLDFSTGDALAKRGYTVLCANVMNKEGILFTQIQKTKSVRAAVAYLRGLKTVEKIVLMGHSGGATLLSAYQAVAENGPEVFKGPEKIIPYPSDETLPPADGIMLLDANWGNAAMQLFSLDPAVEDENSGKMINPELDLFLPENGFHKDGVTYTKDFINRYQRAQSERNNCLIEYALSRLLLLENGNGNYADDEPMIIPGAAQGFFNNKLYAQDPDLMAHTQGAYRLIHADGSQTTEIIHSLRRQENDVSLTESFWEGARFLSVKTFLTSYAVRTESDFGYDASRVWGIDWDSSYSCVPGNMRHVSAPTLVMGMTAGWEFLASETIFSHAAAKDKEIAFVEGATHLFRPAKHMEKQEGQFGDTEKNLYDFVDAWLSSGRF